MWMGKDRIVPKACSDVSPIAPMEREIFGNEGAFSTTHSRGTLGPGSSDVLCSPRTPGSGLETESKAWCIEKSETVDSVVILSTVGPFGGATPGSPVLYHSATRVPFALQAVKIFRHTEYMYNSSMLIDRSCASTRPYPAVPHSVVTKIRSTRVWQEAIASEHPRNTAKHEDHGHYRDRYDSRGSRVHGTFNP
jgi:hypothetical protein